MKKTTILVLALSLSSLVSQFSSLQAQETVLSLADCHRLALGSNKQIAASKLKENIAEEAKKVAKTMSLPKVDMAASYVHTSREVSILNNDQKSMLSGVGTSVVGKAGQALPGVLQSLVQMGFINQQQMGALAEMFKTSAPEVQNTLNGIGQDIADAFRTDTRNIWVGGIEVIQPVYMGGKITAMKQAAEISQQLTANQTKLLSNEITNKVDKAYWMVVSLRHKQRLANRYLELINELYDNVEKMYNGGVATKADVLNVSVKKNEAEMQIVKVDNGVALAKMALCQILGVPVDTPITLADEDKDSFGGDELVNLDRESALTRRAELNMLDNAIDISKVGVKLARSSMLPTLAVSGGYTLSNPNVYNGFQKKFGGMWNIGVIFRMPIWQWNEPMYKINAAKSAVQIAQLEREDAVSLINLQISQSNFKVDEARKKMAMTEKNIKSAEENLRCATMGYKEGMMPLTTVNEAQTAWFKATIDNIDAEIDLKTALCDLKHALGE